MEEEIKINKKELYKQMKEDLIKDGCAKVEIIVGNIPKQPMCDISINGVTYKEVGLLYASLEEVKKTIAEKHPLAILWAKECLEIGGPTIIGGGDDK